MFVGSFVVGDAGTVFMSRLTWLKPGLKRSAFIALRAFSHFAVTLATAPACVWTRLHGNEESSAKVIIHSPNSESGTKNAKSFLRSLRDFAGFAKNRLKADFKCIIWILGIIRFIRSGLFRFTIAATTSYTMLRYVSAQRVRSLFTVQPSISFVNVCRR